MQELEELKKLLDFNVLKTRGEVKLAPDDLDWSRCRLVRLEDGTWSTIKEHAKIGVRAMLANPYFGLYDDMGLMKTAQTIITAQFLFMAGIINRVIVVTPPSVRDVWFDKEIGELSTHLFEGLPSRISEFHAKIRQWDWGDWTQRPDQLRWIITNYEFIGRSKARMKQLKPYCGPKTLFILDESSAVANKTSLQSKACLELRKLCGRVIEMNGTPIPDTPLGLMNQANLLHPSILECPYITIFRERYCIMNPRSDFPDIIGWKNLEDIQRRMAPYVLRRLKENCLDLPPKLPTTPIYVPLDETTWKKYKDMRDELCAWVSNNHASLAGQAAIKAMRLAQITSGFLGGVEEIFQEIEEDVPDFMQGEDWFLQEPVAEKQVREKLVFKTVHEIGREKLDATLKFYAEHLALDPFFKLVVWCRFRPELERFVTEFQRLYPNIRTAMLVGNQKKLDRNLALRLLHPKTAVRNEPALLAGMLGTGAMGHNFTAAHVVLDMSYDYSFFKHKQAQDRQNRPGQTKAVSPFVLIATGPTGQKTIDHTILKIRKNKEDVANWTASAWIDELTAA